MLHLWREESRDEIAKHFCPFYQFIVKKISITFCCKISVCSFQHSPYAREKMSCPVGGMQRRKICLFLFRGRVVLPFVFFFLIRWRYNYHSEPGSVSYIMFRCCNDSIVEKRFCVVSVAMAPAVLILTACKATLCTAVIFWQRVMRLLISVCFCWLMLMNVNNAK